MANKNNPQKPINQKINKKNIQTNLATKKKLKEKGFKNPNIQAVLFIAAILLTGIILYSRSISYNLVYCDDNIFVQDYQGFNANPDNIWTSFTKGLGASYYRPILTASFVLDYQMGLPDKPLEPSVYRRTNLILHLLASILIFITIWKLGYSRYIALIFGLAFVCHPIIAPAPAWISGRNDSMITVFILLSFISLISFCNAKTALRWIAFLFHIIFFAFSMFTKETAGFLPIVALAYIILFRKDKIISNKNIALAVGWVIVAITWFIMRNIAMKGIETPDMIGLDALKTNFPTSIALIGKMFLPYKMHALSNFESFTIISGIVAIIGIAAIVFFRRKKIENNKVLFGVLWYLVLLLPTLLIRIIYVGDFFDYAEHRAYLPMFGIIIILLEIFKSYRIDFSKQVPIIISGILIAVLFARSFAYTPVFSDRVSFWENSIKEYPYKSRGYLDLGKAYYVKSDYVTAEKLYLHGIKLNPYNFNLYIDLSAVYIQTKQYDKSVEMAKKALTMQWDNPLANYNLAKAYMMLGKYEEAILPLETATPRYNIFNTWLDLGVCYHRTGQLNKAIEAYLHSISLNPNYPLTCANLGQAYNQIKDYKNGENYLIRAVRLNPKQFDAYYNLISLYINEKQKDKMNSTIQALLNNGGNLPDEWKKTIEAINQAK